MESLAYACPTGDLLVEGSPVDQALFERHVVDYSTSCRNRARITFGTSRDAGTMSFLNGLVHIAAADSALDDEQARQAQIRCRDNPAWHLPVMVDPVALVHRVDGVEELTLSPDTLAQIFSGVITQWNDPEIEADNLGIALPDQPIEVFSRSGSTGVTEAVGTYLNRVAPEHWPVGGTQSWRGAGQGRGSAQEVLESVRTTPYSLGYVEYSTLPRTVASPTPTPSPTPTSVTATPDGGRTPARTPQPATPGRTPEGVDPGPVEPRLVRIGAEAPIELTLETAQAAVAGMRPRTEGPDLVVDGASLNAPGGWPIHRVTYQVVCSSGGRPDTVALEKDWVGYLVMDATQDSLGDTGRVAVPPAMRDRVRTSVDALG